MKVSIKAARQISGKTITEAASALEISAATLSAYENGKSEPRASTLYKMAEIYGIPIEQIVLPASSDCRNKEGDKTDS